MPPSGSLCGHLCRGRARRKGPSSMTELNHERATEAAEWRVQKLVLFPPYLVLFRRTWSFGLEVGKAGHDGGEREGWRGGGGVGAAAQLVACDCRGWATDPRRTIGQSKRICSRAPGSRYSISSSSRRTAHRPMP